MPFGATPSTCGETVFPPLRIGLERGVRHGASDNPRALPRRVGGSRRVHFEQRRHHGRDEPLGCVEDPHAHRAATCRCFGARKLLSHRLGNSPARAIYTSGAVDKMLAKAASRECPEWILEIHGLHRSRLYGRRAEYFPAFTECPGRESNPHAFRRHPLKMVCLPIPPPGRIFGCESRGRHAQLPDGVAC
jgi:hypothetical protein